MEKTELVTPRYHPRTPRKSIRTDRISPADWNKLDLRISCEDCSFYSSERAQCAIGFNAKFRRADQLADFLSYGAVAQCRYLEID